MIYLERKQYGKNLGMPDVILLAKILRYNEHPVNAHPTKQIKIPISVIESPVYQDALLYKTALEHGIEVREAEDKGIKKEGMDHEEHISP